MPYLSWFENDVLQRHLLEGACVIGRDPISCVLSMPKDLSLSRQHAVVELRGCEWWIRDLDSKNGSFLNGLPLNPSGGRLQDQDEALLGDWRLRFTEHFPGLDGINFIEQVGDLFAEARPEPGQAMVLIRGLELLHRSTENLLKEGNPGVLVKSLLSEALRLLNADRGFVVMTHPSGSHQSVYRIGGAEGPVGLSSTVLNYVAAHRIGVLSNAPLMDPRFGGSSLVELHRGALMCVPMELDGALQGMLFLDRNEADRPFSRFDLALFQAFVKQGTLAHRHAQLAQRAMGQAELHEELLRLKTLNERTLGRTEEILGAMASCLRWLQGYGQKAFGSGADALRHLVSRLQFLVDAGLQETVLEVPQEVSFSSSLEALHRLLAQSWKALAEIRGIRLELEPVPAGTVWLAGIQAAHAVMGIVEPMLLQVPEGAVVTGRWVEDSGNWVLRIAFPPGGSAPAPDAWTHHGLQKTGIVWRWSDQTLQLVFPRGLETLPEAEPLPILGLVSEEYEIMDIFQSVAERGQLEIFPLEEVPPLPPLPRFRYLIVDAKGTQDPAACVQAYRRHPSFQMVPILVVRASDGETAGLLAAGATDWLPESFRWETLHHRLQVLKGYDELQRKALAAERLDSFRKMAGSLKHEINNPLAIISMQIELLQRKYPEEPKLAKLEEMVDRIRGLMTVLQKMREAPVEDYPDGSSILKLS